MPSKRPSSTAELLLDLLENAHLGPTSYEQAVTAARVPGRRVRSGLAVLEAEGLVTSAIEERQLVYRTTPDGVATLELQGRVPGNATVLFTDIVRSTEMIAAFGEAGAHERRQRHFTLLGEAIAACGGREVKRLGDGVMAVFADPAAATACAAAMQRSVAADPDRLGLRIGVHTGELLREGDDFYGTTVIIAARLCDHAAAGETIVSAATRALSDDDRPLGDLALDGLSAPVTAYAAVG